MKRIMRLFAMAVLVLGIGVGATVVSVVDAPPASAHIEDNYAHWYCASHRSNTSMTIVHARVYGLWPGQIGYYCREDFFGVSFQYWVIAQPPGGSFSYMPWDRQKCWPSPGYLVVCSEW